MFQILWLNNNGAGAAKNSSSVSNPFQPVGHICFVPRIGQVRRTLRDS